MLKVTRTAEGHSARVISAAAIYRCAGAIDDEAAERLGEALEKGGFDRVRWLRRDVHDRAEFCWLHAVGYCLSTMDRIETRSQ